MLSRRGWEILQAVIQCHLEEGLPVGSHSLARVSSEHLSSATIRSVMAELEEMGLLSQPHASAGRVPTDGAYRLHVDSLLSSPKRRLPPNAEEGINRALAGTHGAIPSVMEEASRLLSAFSGNVGVVLAPDISRVVFEKIDFVRLEGRRLLAVIVDPAGVVTHRLIEAREEIAQAELDRMAGLLADEFSGLTLPEARARLIGLMAEDKTRYDQLLAQALSIGEKVLEGLPVAEPSGVFLDGASNILGQPDFASTLQMRELFQAFEEKGRLVEILSRCLEQEGVMVRIGSENEDPRLRHCAVLAAPYGVPGRVLGTVAIIGPTRMQYAKAIPLLETLSRALGLIIGQQDSAP